MIYKILIKAANNTMTYALERVAEKEQQIVNNQIVEVPTGKYVMKEFSSTDIAKVKAKYVELLDTYKIDQLDVVADMKETVTISVDITDPSTEDSTSNSGASGNSASDGSTSNAGSGGDTNPSGESADNGSPSDSSSSSEGTGE